MLMAWQISRSAASADPIGPTGAGWAAICHSARREDVACASSYSAAFGGLQFGNDRSRRSCLSHHQQIQQIVRHQSHGREYTFSQTDKSEMRGASRAAPPIAAERRLRDGSSKCETSFLLNARSANNDLIYIMGQPAPGRSCGSEGAGR